MRSSIFFAAMMAAAVSATPVLEIITDITTVTEYVKPGQAPPTPAPVAKPAPVAAKPAPAVQPASNGGSFEQNQPSKPQPSTPSSSSSSSSGNSMLDVANKWRHKYGLPEYTWDDSLLSNCDETGQGGNGVQEIHKLIPDMAMGQVITPGQQVNVGDTKGMSAFEVAYVAWLCEVNTDSELQASSNDGVSVCDVVQDVLTMAYGGETGHHKILCDPSYTKIGCTFTPANGQLDPSKKYQGLYVCDVAQ